MIGHILIHADKYTPGMQVNFGIKITIIVILCIQLTQ